MNRTPKRLNKAQRNKSQNEWRYRNPEKVIENRIRYRAKQIESNLSRLGVYLYGVSPMMAATRKYN